MKRTGAQSSEYAEIAFGGRGREPGGTLFFLWGGGGGGGGGGCLANIIHHMHSGYKKFE